MQLDELATMQADANTLAATLVRHFGSRALVLAEEQARNAPAGSDVAIRWSETARAVAALAQANTHMETALALLDRVDEKRVAARLDDAITLLGLRDAESTQH